MLGQAQLKPETLPKLKKAVPGISAADLETISKAPFRGWDPEILKEPNVYRTYEAITHYGNAIKLLINEKFGDGIMSAIDFYMTVGGTVGKMGEKRVVITFNGKFLPFIEQVAADNSAASPEIAGGLILVLHIPLHILTRATTCTCHCSYAPPRFRVPGPRESNGRRLILRYRINRTAKTATAAAPS